MALIFVAVLRVNMVAVSQVGWLCASIVAPEFGCEWWTGLSQHFLLLVILTAVDSSLLFLLLVVIRMVDLSLLFLLLVILTSIDSSLLFLLFVIVTGVDFSFSMVGGLSPPFSVLRILLVVDLSFLTADDLSILTVDDLSRQLLLPHLHLKLGMSRVSD